MDAVNDAPQAHVDHPLPVHEREVPYAAAAADTRVVAQHVHGAEAFDRSVRERRHRVLVRDVRRDCEHLDTRVGDEALRLGERLGLDIREDDAAAFVCERERERTPDAGARSRHDRDAIPKCPHNPRVPCRMPSPFAA